MKIIKSLQKLGLNYKEQEIYLALLQLEKATANQLAYKANIKRPTTYDIIARLQKDGFIGQTTENGKRLFVATPPEQLIEKIEDQKRELKNDLPFLLSIYNTKAQKPKVAYFEGSSGIKQLYEDTLNSLEKGDEILAYVANETIEHLEEYAVDYVKRRVAKEISLRGIYQDTPRLRQYLKNDAKELRTSRIADPERFPLKNEINIYANKMIILTYSPEPFGILIESNEAVSTQRTIFEMAWQGLAAS